MLKTTHCGRYRSIGLTRREMLQNAACGFGAVALSALLSKDLRGNASPESAADHASSPQR